ncbi:hypothetical protein VCCP10303_3702, partial [Vibrio cholerae CP1030(3)]
MKLRPFLELSQDIIGF